MMIRRPKKAPDTFLKTTFRNIHDLYFSSSVRFVSFEVDVRTERERERCRTNRPTDVKEEEVERSPTDRQTQRKKERKSLASSKSTLWYNIQGVPILMAGPIGTLFWKL